MDRQTVYRDQMPYETDVLLAQKFGYEALGLALLDILGAATVVGGLPCTPTSPASMNVKVGPGRIYTKAVMDDADWGKIAGAGGLDLDINPDHAILKQGLLRDTQTFAIAAPVASGQSIAYLIQASFQEDDSDPVVAQFWNSQNPNTSIARSVSPSRVNRCVLNLKAGLPATTGSQVAPAPDAGWVPVWVVTVAFGATSITAPNIVQHPSAPLVDVGSGGGGGGSPLTPWAVVTANYTAINDDRLIANTTAGSFTVTLPALPAAGDEVTIKGNFLTNNLTIGRNGKTIVGLASDLILNKDYLTVFLVYDGATWRV